MSDADIQTKSVGVTALVASILDQNGMIEDALEMFGETWLRQPDS